MTEVASRPTSAWNPARIYLLLAGAYLLLIGIVGFASAPRTFPFGAGAARRAGSGLVFGLFETNGWHTLAGLLFGLIGLYFVFRDPAEAYLGALIVGLANAIAFVGLQVAVPSTYWLASNGADAVLHGTLGATGILAAVLSWPRRTPTQAA